LAQGYRGDVRWLPLVAICIGAVIAGHYIGHGVEQLGPIGSTNPSTRDVLIEASVALGAGLLAVLLQRRRSAKVAGISAAAVWIATVAGTYFAFNSIAGSHDCPGTQDCDTLMVPVLFPFIWSTALAATAGAVGSLALTRWLRES
jgi:hypothetical protein